MVEEITGEIEDEHDVESDPIKDKYDDGTLIVDARVMIEELEKYYNCKLLDKSLDIDLIIS